MIERIEAWLRARDAHRFQRDIRDSAKSVRHLGDSARATGRGMTFAGDAAHHARGGFMAVGTGARWASFGIGLAAAGAVKMGIEFNSTMEQNTVALDQFLGSTKQSQAMLERLFETAKETPFQFKDVTQAARRFLAFGFTAQDTEKHLRTVGDAIAGIGGGRDEIGRMIIALGQMQAKGRVMGQELLQLTELGIPAYQILQQELGLTADEMKRVGDQGISAEVGIAAIMEGINKRFGGAAARQSKTLAGQWEKLKDTAAQTMGELTKPLFNALRNQVLPFLNSVSNEIRAAAPGIVKGLSAGLGGGDAGGGMSQVAFKIGDALRKGFGIAKEAFSQFLDAIRPALPFFQNVLWPLIKGIAIGIGITLVGAFKFAIAVIRIVATILGWIGEKAEPLKPIFQGIGTVIGAVFGGPILSGLKFVPILGKAFGFLGGMINGVGRVFGWVFGAVSKVVGLFFRFAKWIGGFWVQAHKLAWGTVFGLIRTAISTMTSLPGKMLGLAIRAVKGIASGLKSGVNWVRQAVTDVMNWALGALARGPKMFWNAGVKLAKGLWNGIKSIFAAGAGFAGDIGRALTNFLNEKTPLGNKVDLPSPLPDFTLPKLADGGMISRGGWSWVGEEGPEPVWLPEGASVYPHSYASARTRPLARRTGDSSSRPVVEPLLQREDGAVHSYATASGGPDARPTGRDPQIIQLVVGRRVLAEVVADDVERRKARR